MSDEPLVRIYGGVKVSAEDYAALEGDMLLYGNAYVETFERGLGRRIDPERIRSGEIEVIADVVLGS